MTTTLTRRAATGIAALALALGTAAPASAMRPLEQSSPSGQPASSVTIQRATGGDSQWAYFAIGGGAAGLALLGVGGVLATNRRHQPRLPTGHPRITS